MSIRANLKGVRREILLECLADNKPFTREVQDKAVAAILNGMQSAECREYMNLFADPAKPQQLARLMSQDSSAGNPAMDRARAYLVANGPCGTDTVTNFEKGVSDVLDATLAQ